MVKNLLNLFFPRICLGCEEFLKDKEHVICTNCRHELPLTNYHYTEDDIVKNVLFGRVDLVHATAFLHFKKKSIVQSLMHNLKYKGHEEVGTLLGKWLGAELKECGWNEFVDVVIPVPLHKSRLRERGYNQVSNFGKEIARILEVPFEEEVLLRKFATGTQVFKSRLGRIDNSEAKFVVQNEIKIEGKHVLLVDDIITTGATIESCSIAINSVPQVKLSLATMAITD